MPQTDSQIERITRMEQALDTAQAAVEKLAEALDAFVEAQPQVKKLSEYYGSETWMADLQDDEAGLLPDGLKRGVLSEDAAYDVLTDQHALLLEMLDVVAAVLRDE